MSLNAGADMFFAYLFLILFCVAWIAGFIYLISRDS